MWTLCRQRQISHNLFFLYCLIPLRIGQQNMMDSSKADNDGYIPNEETIYANQPLALQTPLPIKELERFCTDNLQPVQVSNSAGLYVCNRVYYEALHMQQNVFFVHIPKNFDIKTAITVIKNIIQSKKSTGGGNFSAIPPCCVIKNGTLIFRKKGLNQR